MEEIFDTYVKQYDITDPKIKGKWEHSYRVMEKAVMLAKALGLSKENIYLAQVIGLLHDIGRFEQWTNYHTFVDLKSIDHGDFGCELLLEKGMIRTFGIDPKYDRVIGKAIKNHNKAKIEDGLTEQELLQTKLIRDADKLDILYINACLDWIELPFSLEPITKEVDQSFKDHTIAYTKDVRNGNDQIIRTLCFCYDINYIETLIYIIDQHYLEKFQRKLNHDELFGVYFDELQSYIEKRISHVRKEI